MAHLISGLFSDANKAKDAVVELKNKGFSNSISIVAKEDLKRSLEEASEQTIANDINSSMATGGAVGALLGILASFTAITVPGIGGLLIAGPLIALWGVTGAVLGALGGGLLAALTSLGIPEETAKIYESRIKEGDILVTISTDHEKEQEVVNILEMNGVGTINIIH